MVKPSITGEQLVPLVEVPDLLPSRRGKKLHMSTIYRWTQRGARGRILDSVMLGGIRYTSLEALQRFGGGSTAELVDARRRALIRASLDARGLSA